MSLYDYYTQVAAHVAWDGTKDAYGAPDYSAANWDTVQSLKGLFRPIGFSESFIRGKETMRKTHTFYCASPTTAIQDDDRLLIGTVYYQILGVKNPNNIGHHLEIQLQEIV